MEKFAELWPTIFAVLVLVIVWFTIRRIFAAVSDKINNADLHKEETVKVLQEIRDELKELNKKNASGQL